MEKTVYLRNVPTHNSWLYFPNYYKVVHTGKDESVTIQVSQEGIEIKEGDDFFDEVHFIKSKLCENSCDEITRQDFDKFYIETINKINKYSNI